MLFALSPQILVVRCMFPGTEIQLLFPLVIIVDIALETMTCDGRYEKDLFFT